MGSLPSVAVIVPAYNHERYVEASLRSIVTQSLPPSELIVIDDCSKDATAARIEALLSSLGVPTRFIRHTRNQGLCRTLNEGLSHITSDLVGVLASDDELPAGKLEQQASFLAAHPEFSGLMADLEVIDPEGRTLRVDRPLTQQLGVAPSAGFGEFDFLQVALGRSSTYIQTGLFRRDAIAAFGGFDPALHHEDFDFALNLLRRGRLAYLYSVGARYRVVPTGLNRRFREFEHEYQLVVAKHRAEIIRRGLPWSAIEASIWNRKANNRLNVGEQASALWCSLRGLTVRPSLIGVRTTARTLVPDGVRALLRRVRAAQRNSDW